MDGEGDPLLIYNGRTEDIEWSLNTNTFRMLRTTSGNFMIFF